MLGADIIEIVRIEQAFKRHGERFLKRVFTQEEIDYCFKQANPFPSLAARFAAKEAAAKAFGTGFQRGLKFTDIAITQDSLGKPLFATHPQFELSMSHCKTYAIAVVIKRSESC